MKFLFWDFGKGKAAHPVSDNMAIDSDGDLLMRMSDNLSMNLESGEVHYTSSWDQDDDEDSYGSSWDRDDNDDYFSSSWDRDDDY